MTKPSKLYPQVLANPGLIIRFRDFERLLEAFGWRHHRTRGSHRHYVHSRIPTVLTINPDGPDAHRYQVRLALGLIEEYRLDMGT